MRGQAVRESRAGDAFHYRWAARRCLALVDPGSPLERVIVEGSKDPDQPGEYAIDLAEYFRAGDGENVVYHQLKHSTVRTGKDFTFSELAPTLREFARRFTAAHGARLGGVRFSLVTNRRVSPAIKRAVAALRAGDGGPLRAKFTKATALKGRALRDFCALLSLDDREGNYLQQRDSLRGELARYFAGPVEGHDVDSLLGLMTERVLPNSDGEILREDVLSRLGGVLPHHLFPATPQFEQLDAPIPREQQASLLARILANPGATIIHAEGGVGKSVVARQLVGALPAGSWGLVYDCFGGGNYRNPSQARHRTGDALVQMANEMAAAGLCRLLIPRAVQPSKDLFLAFLERLGQAVSTLRRADHGARVVLLIDAADNAEMAAEEAGGDPCFAHLLLRETLPAGCHLAALCRTERIHLLDPDGVLARLPLLPFSPAETAAHLGKSFPGASEQDVREFHRLSGANPRVQAGVLAAGHGTLVDALASLGPAGQTAEGQIAAQLDTAIRKLKSQHPAVYGAQVDAICAGLANLPPFIPLDVLAAAAGVDGAAIRSFFYDLGRPLLLHLEGAVQFRDEPTETWFTGRYAAEPEQVARYVAALERLAGGSAYVARALPALLHRVGDYARLVALALSEEFLPESNPVEARDIRVYRLHFAFKAALKRGNWADACRLAMRAGEEVAGENRQAELLADHLDLIPRLQSAHRVQELVYRRQGKASGWHGEASVRAAALLSGVEAFKDEARGYLRAAGRYLELTLAERSEEHLEREEPDAADFCAFAWTRCNLSGPEGAADFFLNWRTSDFVFEAAWMFARRMVDANRLDELAETARLGAKQLDLLLAATDELLPFGRTPPRAAAKRALTKLARETAGWHTDGDYGPGSKRIPAALSLCESAAALGLPSSAILPVLDRCVPVLASDSVAQIHRHGLRRNFLRATALRAVLAGTGEPAADTLLAQPKEPLRGVSTAEGNREVKETLGALLPWYYLRARLAVRDGAATAVDLEALRNRTQAVLHGRHRTPDSLPSEVSALHFEVLALKTSASASELAFFEKKVLDEVGRESGLQNPLLALRLAVRLPHLQSLRDRLESAVRRTIEGLTDEGPQQRAGWYVGLARAVLPDSEPDARAYFDRAVEVVSRFGDEIAERWNAVVAVAGGAAVGAGAGDAALTYRFIRCGEIVGQSVAREKYWDRDDVFRVAARLHLPSAFAALSRWRDRGVGWFGRQLRALVAEAVTRGGLNPACGWGLTGFLGCHASADLAAVCIGQEADRDTRRKMLRASIRDLELDGARLDEFRKLEGVAGDFDDEKETLARNMAASQPDTRTTDPATYRRMVEPDEDEAIKAMVAGVDVLDAGALEGALAAMRSRRGGRNFESFWNEVIRRILRGQEARFLEVFLKVESIDHFDAMNLIVSGRRAWSEKMSVVQRWPSFLAAVGQRFAHDFADARRLDYWSECCGLSLEELKAVTGGMVKGLAESTEVSDARAFFGFATSAAKHLTPGESTELLDYALARMEKHIPEDFGDGTWAEWMAPGEDVHEAAAGVVWSALGSPYSSTRWEAAHGVRRWAEFGCAEPIKRLVGWLQKDQVGAYGSKPFPFYRFHARLYLLIAFARVALDKPEMLRDHHRVFAAIALEGPLHALIQKNAADIALRLEEAYPETYGQMEFARLRQVGKNPFAMVTRQTPPVGTISPSGQEDHVSAPFETEFDWYWFGQIARVFDVPKAVVKDAARDFAAREFGVKVGDKHQPDPRQALWEARDYNERGTSHSHGSYPRNDTHSFYVSYHSFLAAAATLLKRTPVVSDPGSWSHRDPWGGWLAHHSLTRGDGRWLADRRDPTPRQRRRWVHQRQDQHWECSIQRGDFVDVLTRPGGPEGFLCVHGTWSDHEQYNIEDLWVHSALVNRATGPALANALRSVADSQRFILPTYGLSDAEYTEAPFELAGWIFEHEGSDPCLDRFDPHARNIEYPPSGIGVAYEQMLGLSADLEHRRWRRQSSGSAVAVSEVWSDPISDRRDEPHRGGQRLTASVDLLKELCRRTDKDLIFCVEIKRSIHRFARSDTSAHSYVPKSFKIFLFSHDGILREAAETHRVG